MGRWVLSVVLVAVAVSFPGKLTATEFEILLGECERQYEADQFAVAKQLATKALSIAERERPANPLHIGLGLWFCGQIALDQKDIKSAEAYDQRLLTHLKAATRYETQRKNLGRDWLNQEASPLWTLMAPAMALAGEIALVKEQPATAEVNFREALSIARIVAPERVEAVGEYCEGLGKAYERQGKNVFAIPVYREASKIYSGIERRKSQAGELKEKVWELEQSSKGLEVPEERQSPVDKRT